MSGIDCISFGMLGRPESDSGSVIDGNLLFQSLELLWEFLVQMRASLSIAGVHSSHDKVKGIDHEDVRS